MSNVKELEPAAPIAQTTDWSDLPGRPQGQAKFRFIRAYSTTFRVIFSYLWLSIMTRLRGAAYRDSRISGVHKRNARRVESTILSLQGVFIKVGQLLSIMANFLPEEFRAELETLQNQVPPRSFQEIEERIVTDLGKPVREAFSHFERVPIASASLGQVHRGKLPDGTDVAIKVQHCDIDEMVRLDLKTIRTIMTIVQWFVPVHGLDAYYHQIKELLQQELDFELEADNIERIAKNFSSNPRIIFPVPIRSHSTKKVLTTTFVDGKRIGDRPSVEALAIDTKELAERLVRAYCQMIFVDGVYHADPHPGNILVQGDGSLVLLDFGAVAELSPRMREGIPEFLEGVIRRDTDSLVKALRKMGFLSRTTDSAVSERIIDYFHERFQEEVKLESLNLKDIKIDPQRGLENLLDLRRMNIGLKELTSAFHIPKDFVLLERTILLVYGSCSMLDPDMNPMKIIQPYLQEFVLGNRDWQQIALEAVKDTALRAISLPDDIHKYVAKATRGEMEVTVRGMEEGARTLYAVGRQLIYTALAIACAVGALQLHFHGEDRLALKLLYGAGGFLLLLLLGSWLSRPKRRK